MPVGGLVINVYPADSGPAIKKLRAMSCVEIHGHDEMGNVVAVLDCETSEDMEDVVRRISSIEEVLSVGLTYINAEDEVERMERGEYIPSRSFGNKPFIQD